MSTLRSYLPISVYYAVFFMANSLLFSFLSLYYAYIHLNNLQIGVLTATGAVIALVSQPFWGVASDRAPLKNKVLWLTIIFTSLSAFFLPLAAGALWLFYLLTAVFYFFQNAVNPLSDSIALEVASMRNLRFSRIRLMGSIGFSFMSAIAGWLFHDRLPWIFPAFSILMFGSLIVSFFVPRVKGFQLGKKIRFLELFHNKELVGIYVYLFFLAVTFNFFVTFQTIYAKQQGVGMGLIGLSITISSLSQFPFMLFFDKLYEKFGLNRLLIFSGFIYTIRWLLYGLDLNAHTILWLSLMHGGTFILVYLCLAEFVHRNIRKELQSSGQMMNAIILMNISKIFGGLLGGVSAQFWGIRTSFFLCSAIGLGAMFLYVGLIRIYAKRTSAAGEGM